MFFIRGKVIKFVRGRDRDIVVKVGGKGMGGKIGVGLNWG